MGKQYEMAFQIGAKVQGSFGSAFKSAASSVQSLQNTINNLNKKQSDITGYQKTQQAIEATKNKLKLYEQQYANLKDEMERNGQASAAEQNALLAKGKAIDDQKAKLEGLEKKLQSTGEALKEEGVDLNNLGQASAETAEKIESLRSEQEELAASSDKSGNAMAEAAQSFMEMAAAVGAMEIGKKLGEALKQCTDEAIAFESEMASVKRTVGGDDSFINELGSDFKDLSTQIPITTEELAQIAATAGQLGVEKSKVKQFTEVMAKLATTTDLTADEAATMLAQFANITGVDDYERLGATIADLGDSTATTASKVVEMSQGMAAAASVAGFQPTDIMALAAAVGSLGIESQAGSTAMSQLISTLYKATETGDQLKEFAAVAGMSAEEFKQSWGQDAVGTMDKFITGLNDVGRNGKSAIVILDELGINNVRQQKAILGLANAEGLLSGTIGKANTAWEENTALNDKASIMYNTTESKLIKMQNAFSNVQVAIGDAFTPAIGTAADAVTDLLVPVADFIEDNPALVQGIGAAIAVMGGLTAAMAAYTAATKVATLIQGAFTAALGTSALGPILAIGGALAVVTGAVVGLSAAFGESKKTMAEMDAEFDALNERIEEKQNIIDLCEEYKKLSSDVNHEAVVSSLADAEELQQKALAAKASLDEAKKVQAELESQKDKIIAKIANASSKEDLETFQKELADVTTELLFQDGKVNTLEASYKKLSTQYEEASQKATSLQESEARLQEIEKALGISAADTAGTYAEKAASMWNNVEAIEAMAKAEKATMQQQSKDFLKEQSKAYAEAYAEYARQMEIFAKAEEELTNMSTTDDVGTRLIETYNAIGEALANGGEWDKGEVAKMRKQFEELFTVIDGTGAELSFGNYDMMGRKLQDLEISTEDVTDAQAEWGWQMKESSAAAQEAANTMQTYINNAIDGVEKSGMELSEVRDIMMQAFADYPNGAQMVDEAMAQVEAAVSGAADAAGDFNTEAGLMGKATAADVQAATQPIIDQMNELAQAYTDAYNAAYSSINGQFALFENVSLDEESDAAKTSVDDMTNSLKSQSEYMAEYAQNLKIASEKGISEGLLAQLSNGSKESAQYLQAIVAAGDTEIKNLNDAFAEVEQGKAAFANAVAEMETDFSSKMQQLEQDLQNTVNTMDHSQESAEAAARTVQAYAEAAAAHVGDIENAFAQLSAAAQIKAKISLSYSGVNLSGFNIPGFASGTDYAPEGWAMVGEKGPELMRLSGGEKILNTQETQKAINAESAAPSGSGGYNVVIHNQFDISGSANPEEVKEQIMEAVRDLRGQIEQVMEDVETDRVRRVYA